MKTLACLLPMLFCLAAPAADRPAPLHLRVNVEIEDPARHALSIRVGFERPPPAEFRLHGGLEVTAAAGCGTVERIATEEIAWAGDAAAPIPVATWRWTGAGQSESPVLQLRGSIHHALAAEEQEYARSFSRSPGLVDARGVFLSGATWWVPAFADRLVTFELTTSVPEGWDTVSQGERTVHRVVGGRRETVWTCRHPQEEVYLVAAPFHEYAREAGGMTAYAFLRQPDPSLANRFLETTAQYVEMYRRLIGPYPFSKFAVVENFWETGYGMPSFTLLGPQVIRFPFILHSSYPHEILHNWWGNSVYVDWESGNWCEGLTAYLADHLIKEGQGLGAPYRRDTLKKYRDYVNDGKDFPLVEFRSRHSSATEAVGYGKALMLFHMIRRGAGDEAFTRALQSFFREYRFATAGWSDLARVCSEATGSDWSAWVREWTTQAGAPALRLETTTRGDGSLGTFRVVQAQEGERFPLGVPVALTVRGEPEVRWWELPMVGRASQAKIPADLDVVRVDVDPLYDVFRLLDRDELPPTLGELFGADAVTIVLPGDGARWRPLADAWKADHVEIVAAADLESLPPDRSVWILGADNAFADVPSGRIAWRGAPGARGEGRSFAFALRHPDDPERAVGWIGAGSDAAIPGLARKLPHYGKYSWLGFEGDEPTNVAKGQWEPSASPLVWMREPGTARARLPERPPLATPAPLYDADALLAHVSYLADPAREGRGADSDGLREAIAWVARQFEEAGLQPGADGGAWFQEWTEPGGPDGAPVALRNVVGLLPGGDPRFAEQAVVLGAHVDHLGQGWPDVRSGAEGVLHPGADDNASGVAVLIEVARRLAGAGHRPKRPILFVAFDGEEWGRRGSEFYVRAMRRFPAARSLAMVNLDTVGRLDDRKIQLLGTATADEWKHIAMGIGFTTGIESVCVPQDPGGSDQVSFHAMRVPAVQVFAGLHPDYHSPRDTIDRVDPEGLVEIATFVEEMVVYLGDRERPLSASFEGAAAPAAPAAGPGRRVSFGTMPDFAFAGPGVRVASVLDDSPAAEAGVVAGDILLRLGDEPIVDLAGFSALLKGHRPGDRVTVTLRRGEEQMVLEATLVAR